MPPFHISESWCNIRTDNWACLPSPLHSAPSNRLTVPPLWQQWEYLGGSALIAKWGSCKGTSKSGWRRGHPRGRERGLSQFHGPVGCISNAWGKERWLWLKLDKPHDRWVSRGTEATSREPKEFYCSSSLQHGNGSALLLRTPPSLMWLLERLSANGISPS